MNLDERIAIKEAAIEQSREALRRDIDILVRLQELRNVTLIPEESVRSFQDAHKDLNAGSTDTVLRGLFVLATRNLPAGEVQSMEKFLGTLALVDNLPLNEMSEYIRISTQPRPSLL